MKKILILFLLTLNAASAEILWSDQPLAYKRYFEVQTHVSALGPFLPTSLYTTFIIDLRYIGSMASNIYTTSCTDLESAQISHAQAIQWVIKTKSSLRIEPDYSTFGMPENIPIVPRSCSGHPLSFRSEPSEQKDSNSEPVTERELKRFRRE